MHLNFRITRNNKTNIQIYYYLCSAEVPPNRGGGGGKILRVFESINTTIYYYNIVCIIIRSDWKKIFLKFNPTKSDPLIIEMTGM